MKLAIWGHELTAWVTAGTLAQAGNDVYIVNDTDSTNLHTLMGSSRNEPDLLSLVTEMLEAGSLHFLQSAQAVKL